MLRPHAGFRPPPPDATHHPSRCGGRNPARARHAVNVSVPAAITVFPGEIYQAPRSWAERAYHKLVYFNKVDQGGHFAAWEEPELFTTEIRAAFRFLR
jgi:hypothetical protein